MARGPALDPFDHLDPDLEVPWGLNDSKNTAWSDSALPPREAHHLVRERDRRRLAKFFISPVTRYWPAKRHAVLASRTHAAVPACVVADV